MFLPIFDSSRYIAMILAYRDLLSARICYVDVHLYVYILFHPISSSDCDACYATGVTSIIQCCTTTVRMTYPFIYSNLMEAPHEARYSASYDFSSSKTAAWFYGLLIKEWAGVASFQLPSTTKNTVFFPIANTWQYQTHTGTLLR